MNFVPSLIDVAFGNRNKRFFTNAFNTDFMPAIVPHHRFYFEKIQQNATRPAAGTYYTMSC